MSVLEFSKTALGKSVPCEAANTPIISKPQITGVSPAAWRPEPDKTANHKISKDEIAALNRYIKIDGINAVVIRVFDIL